MSDDFDDMLDDRARRAASAIPESPLGDGDVRAVHRRVRRSRGTTAAVASLLVVGIVATAIGVNATRDDDHGRVIAGTSTTVSSVARVEDHRDDPVLMMMRTCYGMCVYQVPLDLPTVAVYSDGAVVAAERTQGVAPRWELTRATTKLDRDTLDRLLEQARRAGLDDGGVHAAGDTTNSADGGGTVFVARIDGIDTVIEAPLLGIDPPGWSPHGADPAQRARLLELQHAIEALAKQATTPVAPHGYVVVDQPGIDPLHRAEQWLGPPLAALLTEPSPKGACGIVHGSEAEQVAISIDRKGFGLDVRDAGKGYILVGRPLLPHEHTCGDVAHTMARFRDDERERLVSGEAVTTTTTSAPTTTTIPPAVHVPNATVFPAVVVAAGGIERVTTNGSTNVDGPGDATIAFLLPDGSVAVQSKDGTISQWTASNTHTDFTELGTRSQLIGVGLDRGHDVLIVRQFVRSSPQARDVLLFDMARRTSRSGGFGSNLDYGVTRGSIAGDRFAVTWPGYDSAGTIEIRSLQDTSKQGAIVAAPNGDLGTRSYSEGVLSPDGSKLAFIDTPDQGPSEHDVVVRRITSARELLRTTLPAGYDPERLDYDGRFLVVSAVGGPGLVLDTTESTPTWRGIPGVSGITMIDRF